MLALLLMLDGPRRKQAACALAELRDRRDLLPAVELHA